MANLVGTTVTGDLAVTGATSGQGAVPVGAVIPIVSALSGSHTIPSSGAVDAAGWQLCDGEAVPSSQTLSGDTPDLTDGRFLRGFTSSSGCGGAATFTLAEGNLAAHTHGGATGSTTPGAGSACSATTGAWDGTSGTYSADHTHTYTTGTQNCQHCHCICDAGSHSHSYCSTNSHGGHIYPPPPTLQQNRTTATTDGRQHCTENTCCTYGGTGHTHAGSTGGASANHTHTVPSHTHSVASHTHTGAAHTHTVASAGSGTAKSHIPIYFNVKYLIRVI